MDFNKKKGAAQGKPRLLVPGAHGSAEPEYKKIKRSLNYLITDGSFYAVMDGFTANFIVPFALFLKSSNLMISLLSSLPDLLASFFQLLAIKANEVFRSRQRIVVISAALQACVWIPIMFIPRVVQESHKAMALVLLYSLIVMLSYFMSPLWRGFVGDLVSESERGAYFSKRNKITASVNFTSSLIAGGILQYFSVKSALTGFTILFSVAFVARVVSATFLGLMYEKPVYNPNIHTYTSYRYTIWRFLKELTKSDYGKFVLFVCLFRISVSIAAPFFAVLELKHLGFSYFQYISLAAVEIVASVISLGFWGRLNDERGSKLVIILAGLLIPFIPLAYLVSYDYHFLIVVSLFSGAAWAGFNLAVGNFMFDASSPQERVRYASYFQLLHGLSIFLGAMGGGLLLNVMPDTKESILFVFLLSGVGRLAVAVLLFPMLREMRLLELPFGKSFFQYPLIIKPRQRFVQDPFDYYLAYPQKPKKPRPRLYIDPQFIAEPPDPEKKRLEEWKTKKFLERYGGIKK